MRSGGKLTARGLDAASGVVAGIALMPPTRVAASLQQTLRAPALGEGRLCTNQRAPRAPFGASAGLRVLVRRAGFALAALRCGDSGIVFFRRPGRPGDSLRVHALQRPTDCTRQGAPATVGDDPAPRLANPYACGSSRRPAASSRGASDRCRTCTRKAEPRARHRR